MEKSARSNGIICLTKNLSLALLLFFFSFGLFTGQCKAMDSSIIEAWNFNGNVTTGLVSSDTMSANYGFQSGHGGTGSAFSLNWTNANSTADLSHANTTLNGGLSLCSWIYETDGHPKISINGFGGGFVINSYGLNQWGGVDGTSGRTDIYNSLAYNPAYWNSNAWHHFCFVSSSSVIKYYIDGTRVYEGNYTGTANLTPPTTIGINEDNDPTYYDDFVIFNKALNDSEVSAVYADTSGLTSLSFGPGPCVSYTYTDWGACDGVNQIRNIATSTPTGCSGGATPILGQACSTTRPYITTQTTYDCFAGNPCLIDFLYNNTTFTGPDDTLTIKTCDSLPYGSSGALSCASPTSTRAFSMPSYRLLNEFTPDGHVIVPHNNASTSRTLYVATMAKDGSSDLYAPIYYYINWKPGGSAPYVDPFDLTLTYSTSSPSAFDLSAHDMACSAADWADTGNWWTVLRCKTSEGFLNLVNGVTNTAKNKFNNAINSIKGSFPFNLIDGMRDSWQESTNSLTSFLMVKKALAADINTTTGIISSSSAFDLQLPNFLGTGATSTISLFSKTSIVSFVGQNVFDIYYTICRFFVWTLFLIYIWDLITKRTHEEIL